MVPKNIAIAGPESAAMLLVPPYLVWIRIARPFIAFYDWCAKLDAARVRRGSQERTREHGVDDRAVRDDRRVAVGGPARSRGAQRLSRALQIRNRVVADVAVPLTEIHAVPAAAGAGPTVARHRAARWPRPVTPASPSIDAAGHAHRLRAHQGRAAAGRRPRRASSTPSLVRPLPRVLATMPLPDALSRLRRNNSHLALVTTRRPGDRDGRAGGSGRGSGGHGARRNPPCLSGPAGRHRRCSTKPTGPSVNAAPEAGRPLRRAASAPGQRGEAHPVWDFLFSYYSLRPRQLRRWHPGYGVALGGASARPLPGPRRLRHARRDGGRHPRASAGSRADTVAFIADLLRATAASARPTELLRAARVGDGLPDAPTSATSRFRCGWAPRAPTRWSSRCRCAAATSTPTGSSPSPPRAAQRRAAEPAVAGRHRTAGVRARQHGSVQVVLQTRPAGGVGAADGLPRPRRRCPRARHACQPVRPGRTTDFAPIAIETPAGRTEYVRRQQDVADRAAPLRAALLSRCDAAARPRRADRIADSYPRVSWIDA